jgi:hypothetical protein
MSRDLFLLRQGLEAVLAANRVERPKAETDIMSSILETLSVETVWSYRRAYALHDLTRNED